MPAQAYPEDITEAPNYKLTTPNCSTSIHVHLWRQAFVTCPTHEKHSYFSFWASPEYELGPVLNPMHMRCRNVFHKGYNHCSATLAFGEAQMLAGWVDEPFALEWNNQFKLTSPVQQFPPVLSDWIKLTWPRLEHHLEDGFHVLQQTATADLGAATSSLCAN